MRTAVLISGGREQRFHQVKEILGFQSDAEVAQYLINRGLEASAGMIRNWLLLKEVTDATKAQQVEVFQDMRIMFEHENQKEGGQ